MKKKLYVIIQGVLLSFAAIVLVCMMIADGFTPAIRISLIIFLLMELIFQMVLGAMGGIKN